MKISILFYVKTSLIRTKHVPTENLFKIESISRIQKYFSDATFNCCNRFKGMQHSCKLGRNKPIKYVCASKLNWISMIRIKFPKNFFYYFIKVKSHHFVHSSSAKLYCHFKTYCNLTSRQSCKSSLWFETKSNFCVFFKTLVLKKKQTN